MHTFAQTGVAGLLILAVGVGVLIIELLLIASRRPRAAMMLPLLLAIVPTLIGLLGTAFGYRAVNRAVATMSTPVDAEMIAEGQRAAWATTYLGIATSLPLILIAIAGLLLSRPDKIDRRDA